MICHTLEMRVAFVIEDTNPLLTVDFIEGEPHSV